MVSTDLFDRSVGKTEDRDRKSTDPIRSDHVIRTIRSFLAIDRIFDRIRIWLRPIILANRSISDRSHFYSVVFQRSDIYDRIILITRSDRIGRFTVTIFCFSDRSEKCGRSDRSPTLVLSLKINAKLKLISQHPMCFNSSNAFRFSKMYNCFDFNIYYQRISLKNSTDSP